LAKGRNGLLLIAEELEEWEDEAHLQDLFDLARRIDQLQRAACFLGGGEDEDEDTNTAGVDAGDVLEIEDELRFAMHSEVVHLLAEIVDGLTEHEVAAEAYGFDVSVLEDIDLEWSQGAVSPEAV
jgi:hypothetical protein